MNGVSGATQGEGALNAAKEKAKATKIQTAVDEVENGVEKMIVDSQANQAKAWSS
jgi:hypothetical protein